MKGDHRDGCGRLTNLDQVARHRPNDGPDRGDTIAEFASESERHHGSVGRPGSEYSVGIDRHVVDHTEDQSSHEPDVIHALQLGVRGAAPICPVAADPVGVNHGESVLVGQLIESQADHRVAVARASMEDEDEWHGSAVVRRRDIEL